MPTINQLVRKPRKSKVEKSKSPALNVGYNSRKKVPQPAQPFTEISKFPSVSRDIALLLSSDVKHQDVLDAIAAAGVKRLTKVTLFDVYAGGNIEAGKKSMAYNLTFQNPEDSLTDEEVAKYMEKISKALVELGAEIR